MDNSSVSESATAPMRTKAFIREIEARQNLPFALLAGAIACVVAAGIWAAATVITHFQIGYLAVGVGFIVGFAIRFAGRGLTNIYGYIGAGFALVGCLLGNFLSQVAFFSIEEHLGFFQVLGLIDYSLVPQIMIESFHPMDILFYGLALFAGYRYSFHQISEADLSRLRD